MLKASGITAPDFNPGKHNRENTCRPERTMESMLGIDRFVPASFQDAFQSIAGNPGLKSGAVAFDAFSVFFVASFGTSIVSHATGVSLPRHLVASPRAVLATMAYVDLDPFVAKRCEVHGQGELTTLKELPSIRQSKIILPSSFCQHDRAINLESAPLRPTRSESNP